MSVGKRFVCLTKHSRQPATEPVQFLVRSRAIAHSDLASTACTGYQDGRRPVARPARGSLCRVQRALKQGELNDGQLGYASEKACSPGVI